MKVFVTGATGFIGTAPVPELIGDGHEVVGLARSDATAEKLAVMGTGAHRGDLDDPAALAAGAGSADAVIHLAFDHGRMADGIDEVIRAYRRAIDALVEALAGTNKPLIGTSGVMVLTPGVFGEEDTAGDPASAAGFRVPSESAVLAAADRGVRASVVRLAPVVHGDGDTHGFIPMVISAARQAGGLAYVGDGENRWPPCIASMPPACSGRPSRRSKPAGYHGVGEDGVPLREITTALSQALGLPVAATDAEGAAASFGPLAPFAAVDLDTASRKTRDALGWMPDEPTLLGEIQAGVYGASA